MPSEAKEAVDGWQKPYADAGHDIASVFDPTTTKCKRCGAWQIDLSEDLAYGEMRKCASTKPPEAVKVTQADRNLYLALGIFHTCTDRAVLEWGWADNSPEMQRIARHREEAEKRAWSNPALQLVAGYADYTAISDDRWEQGKAAGYRELGEIVAAIMPDHHSGEQ